jgi:hypothetical protein
VRVGEVGLEDRVGERAGRGRGRGRGRLGAAAARGEDRDEEQRRGGQAAAALPDVRLQGAQD